MTKHPAVTFLLTAHQQAEETARAAGGDDWRAATFPAIDTAAVYDSSGQPVIYDEGAPSDAQTAHIVLHDPAAVLRRVAAERQILAEHINKAGACAVCVERAHSGPGRWALIVWPCRTVLLLAEAWGWTEQPVRPA